MDTVVFRPRHVTFGFFAMLVMPFAAGGCVGLAVTDNPVYGCWVLVAWPALALLWLKARTRIVVDDDGVGKRTWSGGAFRAGWADIESWAAVDLSPTDEDADSVTRRLVRLRVRGARWPAEVMDSEVGVPPFEEFVRLLRERISDKEIAEPAVAPDRRPM